jgi:hypothetical protein
VCEHLAGHRQVLGAHHLGDVDLADLILGVAGQADAGLVHGRKPSGEIRRVDDVVGVFEEFAIAFRNLVERFFRSLPEVSLEPQEAAFAAVQLLAVHLDGYRVSHPPPLLRQPGGPR